MRDWDAKGIVRVKKSVCGGAAAVATGLASSIWP
jgi:hypothetical protein